MSHPAQTRGTSPQVVLSPIAWQAHTCDIAGFWWLVSLVVPLHHHTDPWAPQWQAEGICKAKMRCFRKKSKRKLQQRTAWELKNTAVGTAQGHSEQLGISTQGKLEMTLNTFFFFSRTEHKNSCWIQTNMVLTGYLQLVVQINSSTGMFSSRIYSSGWLCCPFSLLFLPFVTCQPQAAQVRMYLFIAAYRGTTSLLARGCWLYRSATHSWQDHQMPLLPSSSALQEPAGLSSSPSKKPSGVFAVKYTTSLCFCPAYKRKYFTEVSPASELPRPWQCSSSVQSSITATH